MKNSKSLRIPERLPRGRLATHIRDTLAVYEAVTVERLLEALPKHLRKRVNASSMRYQLGKLVADGVVLRVMSNAYTLQRAPVTWRYLFRETKPDLYNIVESMDRYWISFHRLTYLLRNDCDLTVKQVGDGLRKLKALGLVEKSGKSDWCVNRSLDQPITH